jgi:hypothetical protein
MKHGFTRRRFLFAAGAAASTVLGSSLFNLDTVLAAPHVRRNLGGMNASDPILVSYRRAIKAMKMLPAENPLNWDYQAAIYGTTLSGSHAAWNTRELGNHFFWSWHRMYLYWFERIIRKMSGYNSWALPFWDCESTAQRTLPLPFRDSGSELYTSNRGPGWNTGAAFFPKAHVDSSEGMAIGGKGREGRAFFTAGEAIERNPHNNVHVDVGGWMGSVTTAAQDPVFYVHTANIDRLWNVWLTKGGIRFDPFFLDAWKNNSYTFFDENGAKVHMTGCDVVRCAEQLNYTYEGEPPQVNEYCPNPLPALSLETRLLVSGQAVRLTDREVSVPIDLTPIRQRLPRLLESKDSFIALNCNMEAEREPGVVLELYLGLPPNTAANSDSPYFLGALSLFSRGIRSQSKGNFRPEYIQFPAKRALEAAMRSNQQKLILRFVATGPLIDGKPSQLKVQAPIEISQVSLGVASAAEPG